MSIAQMLAIKFELAHAAKHCKDPTLKVRHGGMTAIAPMKRYRPGTPSGCGWPWKPAIPSFFDWFGRSEANAC